MTDMAHRWQKLCTEVEFASSKVHTKMTLTNDRDHSSMEPSPCLCSLPALSGEMAADCLHMWLPTSGKGLHKFWVNCCLMEQQTVTGPAALHGLCAMKEHYITNVLLMFSMNHLSSGVCACCCNICVRMSSKSCICYWDLATLYLFRLLTKKKKKKKMCTSWGKEGSEAGSKEEREEGSEEEREEGSEEEEIKYEWMNSSPQTFLGYHPV